MPNMRHASAAASVTWRRTTVCQICLAPAVTSANQCCSFGMGVSSCSRTNESAKAAMRNVAASMIATVAPPNAANNPA